MSAQLQRTRPSSRSDTSGEYTARPTEEAGSVLDGSSFPARPTHEPCPVPTWRKPLQQLSTLLLASQLKSPRGRYAEPRREANGESTGPQSGAPPPTSACNETDEGLPLETPPLYRLSFTSSSIRSRMSNFTFFNNSSQSTSMTIPSLTQGTERSINDESVQCFKSTRGRCIYLGNHTINVPLDTEKHWEETDYDRLMIDLEDVLKNIRLKSIKKNSRIPRGSLNSSQEETVKISLKMVGQDDRGAGRVSFHPCVWILCRTHWACKEMDTAMKSIGWLTMPFEIGKGDDSEFACIDTEVDIDALDLSAGLQIGDDTTLYLNVESPGLESSSCGLLCCTTIKHRDKYTHQFSRIGGLLTINQNRSSTAYNLALSTAHGVLQNPWWQEWTNSRNRRDPDQSSDEAVDTDGDDGCSSVESISDEEYVEEDGDDDDEDEDRAGAATAVETPRLSELGFRHPLSVDRWRNITPGAMLSFLGQSVTISDVPNQDSLLVSQCSDDSLKNTDHSLLRLGDFEDGGSSETENSYCSGSEAPGGRRAVVSDYVRDVDIEQGPVQIICGPQESQVVDGELLPTSCGILLGGQMFRLRTIKLRAPLARGTSGAWVVRGPLLYGIIIATSKAESSAYMMTAERAMSNVKACQQSIETVDLPTKPSPTWIQTMASVCRRWNLVLFVAFLKRCLEWSKTFLLHCSYRFHGAKYLFRSRFTGPSMGEKSNEPYSPSEIESRRRSGRLLAQIDNSIGFPEWQVLAPASLGFFSASYLLFVVTKVYPALLFTWSPCDWSNDARLLLDSLTLVGVVLGMIVFGHLADRLGRTKMYGLELAITIVATIGISTTSGGYSGSLSFFNFLGAWRFLLGIGIGGEYPLSAVLTSEYAPTKSRGRMLASVFFMQSLGRLAAYGISALVFLSLVSSRGHSPEDLKVGDDESKRLLDTTWRIVIAVGAIPAVLAISLRLRIPESPRYTLDVERDIWKASRDIRHWKSGILRKSKSEESDLDLQMLADGSFGNPPSGPDDGWWTGQRHFDADRATKWTLLRDAVTYLSKWKNLSVLVGLSLCWFVMDVAFYGLSLDNAATLDVMWPSAVPDQWNVAAENNPTPCLNVNVWTPGVRNDTIYIYDTMIKGARRGILLETIGALVGGLVTIALIDRIPRTRAYPILTAALGVCLFVAGTMSATQSASSGIGGTLSMAMYGLAQFLFNFGPNTIIYVLAAEVFPTRFRGTLNGLVAASGKMGAILGRALIGGSETRTRLGIFLLVISISLPLLSYLAFRWMPPVQRGGQNRTLEDISEECMMVQPEALTLDADIEV